LNSRVEATGSDEVANLGGAINTMLEALQMGDQQFRQIAQNVRQVLWVKDETTKRVSYVSPPWEHASDITREDLFSNSSGWHETIHPEDRMIVVPAPRPWAKGRNRVPHCSQRRNRVLGPLPLFPCPQADWPAERNRRRRRGHYRAQKYGKRIAPLPG
jgi:PAS domain-containing protein